MIQRAFFFVFFRFINISHSLVLKNERKIHIKLPWSKLSRDVSSYPRREFFVSTIHAPTVLLTLLCIGNSHPALAVGEGEQRMVLNQKPKAPLGALIPAVQQRLLLEECLSLSNQQLRSNKSDNDQHTEILQKLQSILGPLTQEDESSTRSFLGQSGGTNKKDLTILRQCPPNQCLSGYVIRASMNLYSTNLQFSNMPDYTVTDPSWKKQYIRANDGLPDIQRVITADLNLRDLYRNQVQLQIDDASAELYRNDDCDFQELQVILKEAAMVFDQWLDRVDDQDFKNTLQAVLEGKSIPIYDSFYAGFIPRR